MEDEAKVEYMVFPRMSALSEIVWTPKENKDWNDFKSRMAKQFKRYDHRRINYAKVPLDIGTEIKND
jgi:hexosaminidase